MDVAACSSDPAVCSVEALSVRRWFGDPALRIGGEATQSSLAIAGTALSSVGSLS